MSKGFIVFFEIAQNGDLHVSPNIGERSSKCVGDTLKVTFPQQLWIFYQDLHRPCSKSVILSKGFIVIFEIAIFGDFKNEDTSN